MRSTERMVILPIIDQKWREHLYEMDYLKEGIGLRAMAQRDPLVEYQKEGGDMFNAMNEGVKEETVRQLFMPASSLRRRRKHRQLLRPRTLLRHSAKIRRTCDFLTECLATFVVRHFKF